MMAKLGTVPLPPRTDGQFHIQRWSEDYQQAAAAVISLAYAGHVDSRINDQYRSAAGARKFLYNIVQYPGCGDFFRPASFAAFDPEGGGLCGICLASLVSPACGHITQVCVMPWLKGRGVGYELMRHSLEALREAGCEYTSLTVTARNHEAIRLYERMGFRTARHFNAFVWEA
jgi:ribosomal protein S18 acetylase RimI-like enzyme